MKFPLALARLQDSNNNAQPGPAGNADTPNTNDAGSSNDNAELGKGMDFDALFTELKDMWDGLLQSLPNIVFALIAIVIFALLARFGSKIAKKIASKAHLKPSLRDLVGILVYITFYVAGFFVAVTILFPSITPARLIAGLGVTSIAIGFAFKDIVENFIAGVLILWRFPIEIGDFIKVGDTEGKVEDINIRMTTLRQVDGDLVIVPNSVLFKNPVLNFTNWKDRRITVPCGVAYSEDVGEARKVIRQAVERCDTVRTGNDREIQIFAYEFADSAITFEVTWWTGSKPVEIRKSKDEVVEAVKKALDNAGIEIPFPYRTLTFAEGLKLDRSGDAGGDRSSSD